ncbi:MAG: efflux RND transporter periplasmic adaptor subunit [Candidatus Eremiobacteraeota bacterium]|nr:efflux RND transporter periplasmic adaptor subunit [Candidatus Eremiobacteraeota bacterium]
MLYRFLAIAAVVFAAALAGCGGRGQAQHGPPPLNVDTAMAARRDIATFLSLDGQVAPLHQSTLAVQQAGPLVGIYVNEGDRVSAGQLLAKVDDSNLSAQLAQQEAIIAQAAAHARSSELNVPLTQQQTIGGVATAQTTLQSDKAALANAQLTYNQNATLFRQGYVSQAALESARASYVAAQQKVQNDAAALVTAQSNTGQTQVQAATAQSDRAAAASAQAAAHALEIQIGQTSLYAPFGGVITQRLLDPGAQSTPQTPVLQLSQVDVVYININVPDEDLGYVHPGTPVTFATSSLAGRSFRGTISDVNAVPTQGTLSYRARMRQPNPGDLLRGGMLVSVTIQKERHPGAIVVPRSAVAQTERGNSVFIVQDNKAKEVPVVVGIQTDTLSEVRSPQITPGTQVITTRPDALQNGSVVAVSSGGRVAH